jgi:beta-lactamase class A
MSTFHPALQEAVEALAAGADDVRWSVMVRDASGRPIAQCSAESACATASVGKLLLLVEVAAQFDTGALNPELLLTRRPELAVADSGLWQHLGAAELRVDDLAVLVASVSDNWATNVLLGHVGLPAVAARAAQLGLDQTTLHDFVRDVRTPTDPPQLSSGNAAELSGLMAALGAGNVVNAGVGDQVITWLGTGTDLSMVPAGWGLDPLAHTQPDRDVMLWNKTGTNSGVRADVGLLATPRAKLSYAVLANWTHPVDQRDQVMQKMRDFGMTLLTTSRSV